MTQTREMLRDRAVRAADAVGSQDWDATAGASGEIDQKLAVNYDREWIRCLDADPALRMAERTVTADANGRYAVADLSSGSGDSRQRFHRVLTVVRASQTYSPGRLRQFPTPADTITTRRSWFREGTNLMLVPSSPSSEATVTVNYLPPAVTALSADSVTVEVPTEVQEETFAEVVALETAADLLNKGGRETAESQGLRQRASVLREQMLADLARVGEGPIQMQHGDNAYEWGG